jgi:two-component system phosphate regulon sensor histidine kinase PhoR
VSRRFGAATERFLVAVAIVQDLTEMRRLERVRREFVANASHELRTPIANIRAGAETILSAPDDPALAARFLPHLVTESERLSRLVSDLLDLARHEATDEISLMPVDLGAVAGSVVQRLQEKSRTKQRRRSLRFRGRHFRSGRCRRARTSRF